jgi:hypothetical protein
MHIRASAMRLQQVGGIHYADASVGQEDPKNAGCAGRLPDNPGDTGGRDPVCCAWSG